METKDSDANDGTAIFILASNCDVSFQACLFQFKEPTSLSYRALEEFDYRFNLWADRLGVFAEEASALTVDSEDTRMFEFWFYDC